MQDLFLDLDQATDDPSVSTTFAADDGTVGPLSAQVDQPLHRSRRQARSQMEREVAAQVTRALAREQASITATLEGHQKALRRLGARVERLEKRRGGGVPWVLLLLAGGAYGASVLYRRNPKVQEQVQGLLGRLRPEPESPPVHTQPSAGDAGSQVVFRAAVNDEHQTRETTPGPSQNLTRG